MNVYGESFEHFLKNRYKDYSIVGVNYTCRMEAGGQFNSHLEQFISSLSSIADGSKHTFFTGLLTMYKCSHVQFINEGSVIYDASTMSRVLSFPHMTFDKIDFTTRNTLHTFTACGYLLSNT